MLLSVQGLETGYGRRRVLSGVDLAIERGEIVALIGSNGAGKTTTLKALAGALPVWAGRVEFAGQRLDGQHPSVVVRRGLGHCPEGRELFPGLTVLENLTLGGWIVRRAGHEVARRREAVFTLFPILRERAGQHAGTLSGGEQQMLAIGRALMSEPSLLMMDEPSLGLAPLMVRHLFGLIQEINRRGTTVLLVEQNAAASLAIANRAYVMESGRIVLEGEAREVLADGRTREAYLGIS